MINDVVGRNRRILWAENSDEVFARVERVLKAHMAAHGITVAIDRAIDGNAVFRFLTRAKAGSTDRSTDYDLIVLDLDMPHYNGIDTIRASRSGGRHSAESWSLITSATSDSARQCERWRQRAPSCARSTPRMRRVGWPVCCGSFV